MRGLQRAQKLLLRAIVRPVRGSKTERHGSRYGGHTVPSCLLDRCSTVYSCGVGEDVTFDLSLIEAYGCPVFAFDPTPRAIEFAGRIVNPGFHFMPVGLWSKDGVQQFSPPANPDHVSHSIGPATEGGGFTAESRSLSSLLRELGHTKLTLLKLDIEGAEHEVLGAMLDQGIRPRAICVELHGGLRSALRLVRLLRGRGYVPVAVEGWDVTLALQLSG